MGKQSDQTEVESGLQSAIAQLTHELQRNNAYLENQIAKEVDTLDLIVVESETVVADGVTKNYALNIAPQTSQIEVITGYTVNFTVENLGNLAADTTTTPAPGNEAFAYATFKLGNLLLPMPNTYMPTVNVVTGIKVPLSSSDTRAFYIGSGSGAVLNTGLVISATLFGYAVPATLGNILH